MGTGSDPGAPGARPGTLDAGLLSLVAEIAALDAVALAVRDATGIALRASWPQDHGGLELPASVEPADILTRIGASAGAVVTAVAPVEEGVDALIVGDFVNRGITIESSERAIDAFAGLLASSLALEGARRRAEDAGARMASLVDAGLSLGRELAPRRPARADRAVGARPCSAPATRRSASSTPPARSSPASSRPG